MKGIYQSSYEDPSGNVHYMATTQFEAAGARKTFPCFDEPEYKAIFDMTIASKYEEYSATWNLPEASREPHPEKEDYFITKFDQSMLMSTYVMAIVISDYDLRRVLKLIMKAFEKSKSRSTMYGILAAYRRHTRGQTVAHTVCGIPFYNSSSVNLSKRSRICTRDKYFG